MGASGDSEKTYNRQTDRKWGQVCWVLGWRHPTLIASFLYLYPLRPYSLEFFKTLLLKSSLKPLSGDQELEKRLDQKELT
jgi:hypothetical protein